MSEKNYWTSLRHRKISRRTMLQASGRAGVGAAGLALVGCGDDDDDGDDAATAVTEQADEQAEEQSQAEEQAQAQAEEAECSVPWPLDQVDLNASIVAGVAGDNRGLDQMRSGSAANYYSHGAVCNAAMEVDPRDNTVISTVVTPEWIDPVTIRAAVAPAPFHDGSTVTAHDLVFSYERVGGVAAYHDGGAASDHAGGWATCCGTYGSNNWARSEAMDDRTWAIELPAPDAAFALLNMTTVNTSIFSQADTERRGDAAVDAAPMGTGPYRIVSHAEDEDFVFERFEDHFLPIDHPVRVPHYAHNKHLTILVRTEIQSRLAGIEAGEIDMLDALGPDIVQPYLDDPDFTVRFQPPGPWAVHNIYSNLFAEAQADGSPNPFLDLRVRPAANHAVNRQAIIDNLLLGQGEQ